jgi:ubiquinone/menaquinone biosynthesis C-methylase UbiE
MDKKPGKKEKMPVAGYRLMNATFKVADLFHDPAKKMNAFGIQPADVVIDYGCGPGRYIKKAGELAGSEGKVYAADIHPLAIDYVNKKIAKYKLSNVIPVLIEEYQCPLTSDVANLIYALDMFHLIKYPEVLFHEWNRLLKNDGTLILDDGHQPRKNTLQKIANSGLFAVTEEGKSFIRCKPN